MGKKSGSGSGMNNPDHISESLETVFWVKILIFLDEDPRSGMEKFGSGMEKILIRDKHPRFATMLLKNFPIFWPVFRIQIPWTCIRIRSIRVVDDI
jgi:hypothetical protein